MTTPTRIADHTVVLAHRNGSTTKVSDLTIDEARDLAARSVLKRKAASATITDANGTTVGYTESAA